LFGKSSIELCCSNKAFLTFFFSWNMILILLGTDEAQQYDRQVIATPLALQLKAMQAANLDNAHPSPAGIRCPDTRKQPDDAHRRRNSRLMASASRPPPPPAHAQKTTSRAYRHRDSIAVTRLHQEQLQHLQELHAAACQQQQQVQSINLLGIF
jgi:hypothetical protein